MRSTYPHAVDVEGGRQVVVQSAEEHQRRFPKDFEAMVAEEKKALQFSDNPTNSEDVAAAILKERERCAKVAESAPARSADEIAAAIRADTVEHPKPPVVIEDPLGIAEPPAPVPVTPPLAQTEPQPKERVGRLSANDIP